MGNASFPGIAVAWRLRSAQNSRSFLPSALSITNFFAANYGACPNPEATSKRIPWDFVIEISLLWFCPRPWRYQERFSFFSLLRPVLFLFKLIRLQSLCLNPSFYRKIYASSQLSPSLRVAPSKQSSSWSLAIVHQCQYLERFSLRKQLNRPFRRLT